MTDLESEITTLRELDTLRIQSGKLRDEGIDALIALCSSLFCVGDITDAPSLIAKLQSDATPTTIPVSQFVWGQISIAMTPLLANPTSTLPQREFALIQELNKILRGDSIYDTARFTAVPLRPVTRSLNADKPTDHLLIYLNRLLLEDTYPQHIAKGLNKPDDVHQVSRVSAALWKHSSAPSEHLKELMRVLETLTLRGIVKSPMTILLAAGVMEALIAAPSSTFTKPLLCCYYLIIRELYTTDAPDWAAGGTSELQNGMVSAHVTRACVQALMSLARAIENTAHFIAVVGAIHKQMDRLTGMDKFSPALKQWVSLERARLTRSLNAMTRTSSCRLVFEPPAFSIDNLCSIEEYVKTLASQLKETAENAITAFKKAVTAINTFHGEQPSETEGGGDVYEISKFARTEAGHLIATSALQRGKRTAKAILDTLTPPEWYKDSKEWDDLETQVKKISTQIRGLLHPVEKFLSSALNRELAAAAGGSYGEWDVVEMACAAAAYGTVTNEWDDDRLRCVVESFKQTISNHGRFPIGRPFHVDNENRCI